MFFRKESSILVPGFHKSDLSRLKNSFTNEPLWVVTHTACLQRKYQRPNQARRNFNYRWLGFLSYNIRGRHRCAFRQNLIIKRCGNFQFYINYVLKMLFVLISYGYFVSNCDQSHYGLLLKSSQYALGTFTLT